MGFMGKGRDRPLSHELSVWSLQGEHTRCPSSGLTAAVLSRVTLAAAAFLGKIKSFSTSKVLYLLSHTHTHTHVPWQQSCLSWQGKEGSQVSAEIASLLMVFF